ncbi:MAG: Lrp/AsnC family transcriptional regulator [Paracoccaceae bacterium]
MDNLDQKLITALRRDGRESIANLAALLGVTRATVRARMDKLIASGQILGFSVDLKADTAESPVRGLMMIEVEGRGTERVVARLLNMPEVLRVHATNGRWDLVAELRTTTLEKLDEVLRAIRLIDGIATSETSLLLATRQHRRI